MSAAIFSRLIKRVSLTNFATHRLSSGFSPTHSRHILLHHNHNHHVKWCHSSSYVHGLPEIPNDGKVVLLKNSVTGSELYLVGTCHISQESADTVRKVINSVRPDVIAVELCRERAIKLEKSKPENDNLYSLYRNSMRAPGGLCMKISMFILLLWYRKLRADGFFLGQEFKVAMEQSIRVKARFFCIDQDQTDFLQQLSKILSFDSLRRSFLRAWGQSENSEQFFDYFAGENTRSSARESNCSLRKIAPEICKVLIEDRDKLMFTRLRKMDGNVIVGVVGLAHMDGIESLWKLAEDDDDKSNLPHHQKLQGCQLGEDLVRDMIYNPCSLELD